MHVQLFSLVTIHLSKHIFCRDKRYRALAKKEIRWETTAIFESTTQQGTCYKKRKEPAHFRCCLHNSAILCISQSCRFTLCTYLYLMIAMYVKLDIFASIFNLLTSQQWQVRRKTKTASRFQLTFCCWSLFYYVVRVELYFCNSSSILYIQAISKVW